LLKKEIEIKEAKIQEAKKSYEEEIRKKEKEF
jgi:hypothetical protein